jgi:thiosulfate/3-mercaptopyruvate sulfurtransferase
VLVTPPWLAEHLGDPGLVVVDLRWREDGSGRAGYELGHVPGAVFCDWTTDIVDREHRTAFMLATPDGFAAAMRRLGISDDTAVVAYADQRGSGPFRLWWACRVYGHDQVRILDGGLERWMAEGHPLEAAAPTMPPPGRWTARPGAPLVAGAAEVAEGERNPAVVVLDSRPPFQFRGEAVWFETGAIRAEDDGVARTPRGPLRAGHVPWARNVPSDELYRPDGTLKAPDALRELFVRAGVGREARVITYCGVGISASALAFALGHAGVADVRLYDASWEEWGRDPGRPVARGDARGGPRGGVVPETTEPV